MNQANQAIFDTIGHWLETSGVTIVSIMLIASVTRSLGNIVVRRIIHNALKRDSVASASEEKKREKTLVGISTTTLNIAIWTVASLLILQEFVNIAPLIAGVSVAGIALGFGTQSLVKDFVSGLFIILENQYRVGDVIQAAGVSGKVESITMRQTILRDVDGNVHHIPNGLVTVATNMTMDYSKINLTINTSYEVKIDKIASIIDEVGVELMNDDAWGKKVIEAPHFVRVDSFGVNDIQLKILGKVKPGEQWSVAGEFRKRLLSAFSKHHINSPIPQQIVHQLSDKK